MEKIDEINDQNRQPVKGISALSTEHVQKEMAKGSSNIMVAVRLRPLWPKEIEKNEVSIVKILDEKVVCLADPADFTKENAENELRKNRTREKQFAFDFAFNEKTPT